jgi:hypothetical protein
MLLSVDDDRVTYGVVGREGAETIHEVRVAPGHPPAVCGLHEQVLDHVAPGRLRYTHDAAAAEAAVRAGNAAMAYVLPETHVERVWAVAESGSTLPQKSTYFWPKPRTGLVIRPMFD